MSDVIMVLVTDDSGKRWNINLAFVSTVQFPSQIAVLSGNFNLERVTMMNEQIITLPLGTWVAALAALEVEYDMGPASPRNVSTHLFIGTT